MKNAAAVVLSLFCAAVSVAAQEDSPLVRAAKIGAARRRSAQKHIVIDDAVLKASSGHISAASGIAELPPLPAKIQAPPAKMTPPALSPLEIEKLQKEIAVLKEQRERLNEQADQPYTDDGSEDQIPKRLGDIEKRLADAEKKLNPPQ